MTKKICLMTMVFSALVSFSVLAQGIEEKNGVDIDIDAAIKQESVVDHDVLQSLDLSLDLPARRYLGVLAAVQLVPEDTITAKLIAPNIPLRRVRDMVTAWDCIAYDEHSIRYYPRIDRSVATVTPPRRWAVVLSRTDIISCPNNPAALPGVSYSGVGSWDACVGGAAACNFVWVPVHLRQGGRAYVLDPGYFFGSWTPDD